MNGILNVLKPPGMTSHDVVSFVRRVAKIKKVGHTGTLDPGAAGVLPICIGKATKIVDFIMNDRKTYICELTLGNRTDTYDKYGEFLLKDNITNINVKEEDLREILKDFKGKIKQKPPAYSAIKINGVRAYDLARNGVAVDVPEREVEIYNLEVLKCLNDKIMLKIHCSKGTYIRSICNDIGEKLGYGAYMSFLIRTGTGNFNIDNSYCLEEINSENFSDLIIETHEALNFKDIYIDDKYAKKLLNGNTIEINNKDSIKNNELVKIFLAPSNFIGIGKVYNNKLYVEKLLV